MRGSTTPITIFSAEKDEEQAANYDDRWKAGAQKEWMRDMQSEMKLY